MRLRAYLQTIGFTPDGFTVLSLNKYVTLCSLFLLFCVWYSNLFVEPSVEILVLDSKSV